MSNYWRNWIKKAGVRAIKTVAQTAASLIAVGTVLSEVDWVMVGSSAVVAGILSLLTSLAGIPECPDCEADADE